MPKAGKMDFPGNGRIGRRLNRHLTFFKFFEVSYLKIIFTGDILSKNEGEFA
jgi:hypothetical protein